MLQAGGGRIETCGQAEMHALLSNRGPAHPPPRLNSSRRSRHEAQPARCRARRVTRQQQHSTHSATAQTLQQVQLRRLFGQPSECLCIRLQELRIALSQAVGVKAAAHGAASKVDDEGGLCDVRRVHVLPPAARPRHARVDGRPLAGQATETWHPARPARHARQAGAVSAGAPAVDAILAGVKVDAVHERVARVEQVGQHILLVQADLVGRQASPQLLQARAARQRARPPAPSGLSGLRQSISLLQSLSLRQSGGARLPR